jgi:hypothetical protein
MVTPGLRTVAVNEAASDGVAARDALSVTMAKGDPDRGALARFVQVQDRMARREGALESRGQLGPPEFVVLLVSTKGLHMAVNSGGRRRGKLFAVARLLMLGACALVAASCTSPSYQAAAIEASQGGDQKRAVNLIEKDVARYSAPGQCSGASTFNCGTLALTYGSLAEYQILDGDKVAGERSFGSAKDAINRMDQADKPSAVGMVYRDVSEAYWKIGDRARAVTVIKEGHEAGGDSWLSTAAAADAH